ncbi:MAG: sigma-70 family polymerase sigma factor [Chitinophagaceae bacterium]|nr:sigma-70 family polymerase sigma factor [Chitinophagaceae bacterium]
MLTEEEIINGCKQYNKAAQMVLYKQYVGKMNALSYRYVNSYDDAKDIVQESFIKIFSSISKYKGGGSLEGWIRRIIVNASIDYLKKKKRHIFVSLEQTDTLVTEENLSETDDEYSLDRTAFTNEELMSAINALPEMYKLIFNMHCIENYSHKEIADTLSIREDTSRSRLRRARLALKEHLTGLLKKKMQQNLSKGINSL